MSKKVLSIGLNIVGFGLMFVPGIGTALGLGAKILGGLLTVAQAVGVGAMIAGSLLAGAPKPKALKTSPSDRLTATLDPTARRKISFGGPTALGCDVRYQAFTGADQEYLEMIVCHASHACQSVDTLYLDNELAWSGGAVFGRYVGYLTVTPITEGTRTNGIAIDSTWTANCTLTGCAYTHVKAKLVGPDDKTQSPFAGGVTSRMTFIGKGAKLYDPRKDSTVTGGSGTHRADDQTTWQWDDNACRNPALQELFYELGWKINGKLAVGKGVPPARLDRASYAVAANACDESVALAAGGSEPRYRADGVVSEGDDPGAVRDNLCASMNAVLRDAGASLALDVLHDDLATPVTPFGKAAFDEDDVLAEMQWEQTPSLNATFNICRGRRVGGDTTALYQMVDFPEQKLASPDGIDRIDTIDLVMVQSNGQAQRLAKQRLQRNQYQGKLSFTGGPAFWSLNLGDVFPLKHAAFGWNPKLFRCAGQKISRTGTVEIVAVEENSAIYAWDHDETPAVVPGAPVVYDPLNNPFVRAIGDAGNSAAPGDANRVSLSKFEQGLLGWTYYLPAAGPSIGTLAVFRDLFSDRFGTATGNFTAAGQQVILLNDAAITGNTASRIPVTPGERVFVSATCEFQGPASAGGSWTLQAVFKDDANNHLAFATAASGSAPVGPANRAGGFAVVPAGAAYISLELDVVSGAAGAFTATMGKPMVCGAGAAQTVFPAFSPGPSNEPGAEITRWIEDPPQSLAFKYDYTGATAEAGQFPRDLTAKLMTSAGPIASGVAWTYTVLTGTVNGFTSASGAQPMSGTGTGTLSVTSLGSETATVQLAAAYAGKNYVKTIVLTKEVAAPPSGGATQTVTSKSSGFASPGTTSFTDLTGAMAGPLPAGKTAATVNVVLNAMPASGTTGSWTLEAKVMRDIAGTPTQIGSSVFANSNWNAADVSGDPASFAFAIADSGLTAGTSYTWRVYARLTSGSRVHYVTGSVTVIA